MNKYRLIIPVVICAAIVARGDFSRSVNAADNKATELYIEFSPNTEPGEYRKLYAGLPDDPAVLCGLIKKQLIHPTRIGDFPELEGLEYEDTKFYTVKDMLAELVKRNKAGLVQNREPKDRLRVSCRFHSLLLASILKTKKIPVRVRVGFAGYLVPQGVDKRVDHWICEVWDKPKSRWILVDPDIQKIDFSRAEFEFAGDVWLGVHDDTAAVRYGVGQWWGKEYIKANTLHDFFCVLGNELIYWEGCALARKSLSSFTKEDFALMDKIARLLKDPDTNLNALREISKDPRLGDIMDYPRYE